MMKINYWIHNIFITLNFNCSRSGLMIITLGQIKSDNINLMITITDCNLLTNLKLMRPWNAGDNINITLSGFQCTFKKIPRWHSLRRRSLRFCLSFPEIWRWMWRWWLSKYSGVNFINVLCTLFSYESLLISFSLLRVWL